jgi:hypothetical protein
VLTVHPTLLIGPADWQRQRMPQEEFDRRIKALWHRCPAASRAIVYGDPCHHAELAYFTNFVPKLEPAIALLSVNGQHKLLVGGGPNMLDSARPLTFMNDLEPLRGGDAIGRWAAVDGGWPDVPLAIAGHHMAVARRASIVEVLPNGQLPADATADVWALMRAKSSYELLAIREACLTLRATVAAIGKAARAGAGVTAAILAGERAANGMGAQDVRTLFSVNGGRTLGPFVAPVEQPSDPLQIYVAVRRFNYWAEGFVPVTERSLPAIEKARELLRLALGTMKSGTKASDVAKLIAAAIRPYRAHPVTERAFVNAIGLALHEPPYFDVAAFEPGEVYSVRVGLTDDADRHAIVSAMVRIREDGNEVLWS